MSEPISSPHYSLVSDRIYPVLNLVCRIAQCDDPASLVRAHRAVIWLALRMNEAEVRKRIGSATAHRFKNRVWKSPDVDAA